MATKAKAASATAEEKAKTVHKGKTADGGHEIIIVEHPEVKNKVGRVINGGQRFTIEVPGTGYVSPAFSCVVQSANSGVKNFRSKAEYLNPDKEGKIHPTAKSVWKELTGDDLKAEDIKN